MAIATLEEVDVVSAARVTAVDRTTAHVAIGNMERNGWIRRRSDPADKRRHLLSVTRAGQDLMQRTKPALERVKRRLLERLSVSDRETLLRILGEIIGDTTPPIHVVRGRSGSEKPG